MKNTAKLSLLLLMGAAQQSMEAAKKPIASITDAKMEQAEEQRIRKTPRPVKPTAKQIEMEKKRVIYRVIENCTKELTPLIDLPRYPLEWNSLPPVKDVTEAQLNKARHEFVMQEEQVQELLKKRNDYLMYKYPVYAEEQKLQDAINKFWNDHREELWAAYRDDMDFNEIYAAEDKAQPYFWKYWQLRNQYNLEHQQFLPVNHRPYAPEKELTPAEIQKLARNAKTFNLAPGKSLLPGKKDGLPILYSSNGTNNPKRVIKYSLALPDGKDVSEDEAVLRSKAITDKSPIGVPGATATTYEYTISSPRHAAPATFYVLEHHLTGDISVYATVRITKGEDSVMPAPKKEKKAATSKPTKAVRRETPQVPLVPVKVKHTPGKKVAAPAPAKKTSTSALKKMKKDNGMNN